jgi:hypothetical protein
VLSGTIGDKEFYERVGFTCGGRLINSWAMSYPKAVNSFYDRVLQAVRAPTRPEPEALAIAIKTGHFS